MTDVEIVYRYGTSALRPRPADAPAALLRLNDGSRAFAALLGDLRPGSGTTRRIVEVDARDLGLGDGPAPAPSQHPFAAVIGCSDARVPVELVFGEGPNDLFVMRIAGNGLGSDVLGSLRYAAEHLRELRLVAVLGHSGCGAVTAAVDIFLDPHAYLALDHEHALRGILDRLLIVVHAASRRLAAAHGGRVSERPGYRSALVETAVTTNAALTAHTIGRELGTSRLRAAYGVYLLGSRSIWTPEGSEDGLSWPPADTTEFDAFGERVVRSARIVSILDGTAG